MRLHNESPAPVTLPASLLLAVLLACAACNRTSRPQPTSATSDSLVYSSEDDDAGVRWWCSFHAPIVLAGRIESVHYSDERKSGGPYDLPYSMVHLSVRVGDVLKGAVTTPIISIDGFVLRTGGFEPRKGNPPIPRFDTGQERIFFLREHEGTLRLARDMYDYTLRLYGGIQADPDDSALDARKRAAALLLRPPSSDNATRWAGNFNTLLAQAHSISSRDFVLELVADRGLTKGVPSAIRATAVNELQAFRTYSDPALAASSISPTPPRCPDFGQE